MGSEAEADRRKGVLALGLGLKSVSAAAA